MSTTPQPRQSRLTPRAVVWRRQPRQSRLDLWLILLLAAVLRFWALDIKDPHFDEGINGWFADRLREQGGFVYDPTNYHGPWHFYSVFLSQSLFGRNIWALRLPAILASLLCIPALFLFARWFGRRAARWAALAFAVSPAAMFYGRYSIHEPW
ncbi:MAG: glycosyltransferase family 39 protein, partial [Chthoniobacterales bacterium]